MTGRCCLREKRKLAERGSCSRVAQPIPRDVLRHALFDPSTKKRRIAARLPGYAIDADDLHRAVAAHVAVEAEDVDAAIRSAGGHRMRANPLEVIRSLTGRQLQHGDKYWLSLTAYRALTRRD